jgi:hypothetical protein
VLNIEEIIEIADNHVFEHQGRHLNDLQRAILERTLQGRSYADIATEHHHSEKYIKDSASKLWKSLSQAVGKKVNKFNVKSTLGRCTFSSTNIFKGIQINSGNIFKESAPSPENDEIIHKQEQITSHIDLKDVPEIGDFYGRKVVLSTTKHQSCLIINSSEEIRELSKPQNDHSHVFTLELLGLDDDGVNILKKFGLNKK